MSDKKMLRKRNEGRISLLMVLLGRLCKTWREDRLEVEEMTMDTRGATSWKLKISPSNLHISVIMFPK